MKKKRIAIRLVLLLLAGAIINVAVAWTRHLLPDTTTVIPTEMATWTVGVPQNWPEKPSNYRKFTSTFGSTSVANALKSNLNVRQPETFSMIVLENGWPMRAMRCYFRAEGDAYAMEHPTVDGALFGDSRFPILLLPDGFAINTIFYAGILWGVRLLFTAPGFVRRRIRIMRHHCPACNYPIGTSPVCTECGAPLSKAVKQP